LPWQADRCVGQRSSTGVHQNMRGMHHYARIRKGASQTCHTKPFAYVLEKLSVSKNEPLTNQ